MSKVGFYGLEPWQKEYAEENSDVEKEFFDEKISPEHLPNESDVDILSIFVDSKIDGAVMDRFPNLKFIATRSTGFDHIDLEEAERRGVKVSNVPSYGENTVAEHAFALILSLSRKIYMAYNKIREDGDFSFDELQGFDLKGKTLGVIGTGRIGKYSIKIAKGFSMDVVAYDKFPNEEMAKELGFEYVSLEDLAKKSDVITIHVPYSEDTHHMVNEAFLDQVKKGAYLINTSRGAIVDTQALVFSLKEGRLGGAGLDVFEEEGVIKDELDFLATGKPDGHDLKTIIANHILIDLDNVIVTPHNAFNTREAILRILDTTLENIKSFVEGKPQNLVS